MLTCTGEPLRAAPDDDPDAVAEPDAAAEVEPFAAEDEELLLQADTAPVTRQAATTAVPQILTDTSLTSRQRVVSELVVG